MFVRLRWCVMSSISAVDAAWRAGITYRQLDHWCRAGYLQASNAGGGSGNPRWLTWSERTVLDAMAGLVRAGVRPERAAALARGDREAIAALEDVLAACRVIAARGAA